MNTKFVNNLPDWGKYVTNVKQNMDISTTPYVQNLHHLKAIEPHVKSGLSRTGANFPPTNQPGTQDFLTNSRTHATVHVGHIVTEPNSEGGKAPGNVGNNRVLEANEGDIVTTAEEEDGHVARLQSDKVSMIAILTDLQTQLDGHAKVNQEKCLEVETLKNELSQCKQEIYRLDTQKVKLDLENKVRQEQALVIQRKEKSLHFYNLKRKKILYEKKDLADSYLDEIVCLKNANKVARDMLQRFNMPTQTIPMLSKKPKNATNDLHKDTLGTRNPGLGYMAKRAQPVLYDADTLLHPTHHPVSIWDSEEVLVHQVVSMKKMNEKPGHVRPANGFYDKLNALKFVPQQELSREQGLLASGQ
ncbi:hypothetical protein Tco_0269615 [Tanacetum coccineum]